MPVTFLVSCRLTSNCPGDVPHLEKVVVDPSNMLPDVVGVGLNVAVHAVRGLANAPITSAVVARYFILLSSTLETMYTTCDVLLSVITPTPAFETVVNLIGAIYAFSFIELTVVR